MFMSPRTITHSTQYFGSDLQNLKLHKCLELPRLSGTPLLTTATSTSANYRETAATVVVLVYLKVVSYVSCLTGVAFYSYFFVLNE